MRESGGHEGVTRESGRGMGRARSRDPVIDGRLPCDALLTFYARLDVHDPAFDVPGPDVWGEVLRVLKPGASLVLLQVLGGGSDFKSGAVRSPEAGPPEAGVPGHRGANGSLLGERADRPLGPPFVRSGEVLPESSVHLLARAESIRSAGQIAPAQCSYR
jgi:hypothetical protein